jgi:D-3-phosphoglycerate dehydrogenase
LSKVLVSDPIAQEGINKLKEGAEVVVKTGLPPAELIEIIPEFEGLVVRSETKVTSDVLHAARNLKVVARAGVGVDNIDVAVATERGVLVVNSPEGNTIAAAEHTIALMLSMSRNIPTAHASLTQGEWKRSKFVGVEVYGKTLGVIGLGKIGREVAKRARGLEMQVLGVDPFISPEQAERLGIQLTEMEELIAKSDYITVHVPMTRETRGLLNRDRFAKMKRGVRIINCARGGIVSQEDLAQALKDGVVAGAALDVFEQEPLDPNSPLLGLPNLVLTPHLGASTREAQIGVAMDVAEQVLDVLAGKTARSAVNLPFVNPEVMSVLQPFMFLAEKMGRFHQQQAEGRITSVDVVYRGDLADMEVSPISRALLKGLLQPLLSDTVTFVNAPLLAEGRGIRVVESKTPHCEDYTHLIEVSVKSTKGTVTTTGTLFGKHDVRIVGVDGFRVDVEPRGYAIVSRHIDTPGIVGRVGTALGKSGVNIAGMHLGRSEPGKLAVMLMNVDQPIPDALLDEIAQMEGVSNARLVEF